MKLRIQIMTRTHLYHGLIGIQELEVVALSS